MAETDTDGDAERAVEESGVAVDRIGKTYEGNGDGNPVRALDDVSFAVDEGSSSVSSAPPAAGRRRCSGSSPDSRRPPTARSASPAPPVTGPTTDMGVVFQEYHLFPWLTVEENVGFGLERSDRSEAEQAERVDEMLDLVGLTEFRDSHPKSLSGGMKQRVAIARSLAVDPELLLMDEPFGAVDAQTREMLQRELLDVWGSTGKTVLFVTHDVAEAVTLADRIVVMAAEPGRVAELVDVDVPRPRERGDPAFGEHVARVRELIGAGP